MEGGREGEEMKRKRKKNRERERKRGRARARGRKRRCGTNDSARGNRSMKECRVFQPGVHGEDRKLGDKDQNRK